MVRHVPGDDASLAPVMAGCRTGRSRRGGRRDGEVGDVELQLVVDGIGDPVDEHVDRIAELGVELGGEIVTGEFPLELVEHRVDRLGQLGNLEQIDVGPRSPSSRSTLTGVPSTTEI